jgi:hypothetical protein
MEDPSSLPMTALAPPLSMNPSCCAVLHPSHLCLQGESRAEQRDEAAPDRCDIGDQPRSQLPCIKEAGLQREGICVPTVCSPISCECEMKPNCLYWCCLFYGYGHASRQQAVCSTPLCRRNDISFILPDHLALFKNLPED